MRILITASGSWGTGSFTVVNAITKEFLKLGHEVKVFFPDAGFPSEDKNYYYQNTDLYKIWEFPIEKNGIVIPVFPLMIPDPHPRAPTVLTFKELSTKQLQFYFADFKKKIKKIINEFQPNIIECQHIWAMAGVIHELGLPYLVTAHHSDQMGFRYDSRMQKIAKSAASNAKYIFAISNYVKNEVKELYNTPQKKIIELPNSYDKKTFTRQAVNREQFLVDLGVNIPSQADMVSFAGKISYTKGMDIILRANQILNNPNIHFLLLGAGNINDILQMCYKDKHSLNRVHFIGHQPPAVVAQAHNISKLSIMPSRDEGFGIAALEAMGCGLPVVVTRNTGPESFVVGKIIEQENPQQLADAILAIINLPESQYSNLSARAKQAARQFSWHTIAQTRLHYYKKCC